jgi:hypothetical protein
MLFPSKSPSEVGVQRFTSSVPSENDSSQDGVRDMLDSAPFGSPPADGAASGPERRRIREVATAKRRKSAPAKSITFFPDGLIAGFVSFAVLFKARPSSER